MLRFLCGAARSFCRQCLALGSRRVRAVPLCVVYQLKPSRLTPLARVSRPARAPRSAGESGLLSPC